VWLCASSMCKREEERRRSHALRGSSDSKRVEREVLQVEIEIGHALGV